MPVLSTGLSTFEGRFKRLLLCDAEELRRRLQPVILAARDKDNAQRDDCLDWRLRHMHKAERRCEKRQAVRDREGGDGLHQPPAAARDDEQRFERFARGVKIIVRQFMAALKRAISACRHPDPKFFAERKIKCVPNCRWVAKRKLLESMRASNLHNLLFPEIY